MSWIQKALTWATLAVLLFFLSAQIPLLFYTPESEERINEGEVHGATLYVRGVPYTLNYQQQNLVVNLIQEAKLTEDSDESDDHLSSRANGFDKIVLHRFGGETWELYPELVGDGSMTLLLNTGGETVSLIVDEKLLMDMVDTAH